jgi:hypothetical protein
MQTKRNSMAHTRGMGLALTILLCSQNRALATDDWYVATDAQHTFDGQTWATAFTNVQHALDAAVSNDTILLAGQTFWLTNQLVWTNAGVTVRGGYEADPGGASPGNRDPDQWPTVLARATNSVANHRILYINNASSSTLELVTLTGGYVVQEDGGGMRVKDSANVQLLGCTIVSNTSFYSGAKQLGKGGGLHASGSSLTLSNCVFTANSSRNTYNNLGTSAHGGGIWSDGTLTLRNCRFLGNMAIAAYTGTDTRAYYGLGGGLYFAGTQLLAMNVLVANNIASGGGAPFKRGDGVHIAGGSAVLVNATITDHELGEGLRQAGGTVSVSNSIVCYNGSDIVGTVAAAYSNVGDFDYGGQNISADPVFEYGYYLAPDSPCVGVGAGTADDLGLADRTTRADGTPYAPGATVNMGWHYPGGTDLTYTDIYVAINGSDANSGTNAVQPLATLARALALASDGTCVHLAAGTYSTATGESFPVTVQQLRGVEIRGEDAASTILDAAGADTVVLVLNDTHHAVIRNLTLKNGAVTTDPRNGIGFSDTGGGLRVNASGRAFVYDCLIESNTCTFTYDGTAVGGGVHATSSDLSLMNCILRNNGALHPSTRSGAYAYGGGIWSDGELEINNCAIHDNRALSSSASSPRSQGGALYFAGTRLKSKNGLLANNNTRDQSDGLHLASGATDLLNVTVADNNGEGIRRTGGALTMTNSIAWNNGDEIVGAATVGYSLIGDGAVYAGEGNKAGNPLFVNAGGGNYRLQELSPAAGAGIVQAWMADATDLGGNPRRSRGQVDMGCYQIPAPAGTLILLR